MTEELATSLPAPFYVGYAKRAGALIHFLENHAFEIVHTKRLSARTMAEIRRYVGCPVSFREVNDEDFDRMLVAAYETGSSEAMQMVETLEEDLSLDRAAEDLRKTEDLLDSQDDAPIIRLINAILSEAIKAKASDIHIESFEENLSVRFRVDGILRRVLEPQKMLGPLLVSRVKVMAKLDIAEKRLPQDGRIALRIGGRSLDVRVSTMPASHGERIVLRLLEKSVHRLDLRHLGMSPVALEAMQKLLEKPHGILLVTGPTGAGKTTTLYAALTVLNQTTRNILTVEDPVEYDIAGIGQTQVNTKVEMTFAKGLRAILRQDPDVVMVGEIRDIETAQIAVQASLTGHLVLSTLHTNTAIGAVTRLRNMGIEKFLLSTSLSGVIAQRLVRLLCKECKKPRLAQGAECRLLGFTSKNPPTIYDAAGCPKCNHVGYTGRLGIYEVVTIDNALRKMISEGASEMEMEYQSRATMPSMRKNGMERVLAGQTTIEEILRVTAED